jgi:hypothetical protein
MSGVNFVTSVMPPIHLKSGSSTKRGQTCEIVQNGKQFYEERSAGGERTSARTLQKAVVRKKVEEATKVSERTVTRILREQKKHEAQGTSFSSHGKTHKVTKRLTDIDDFDKCAIRLTIHELYV